MTRTLLVLGLLLSLPAKAAGPIIWNGSNSKDLTSGGLITPKLQVTETGGGTDTVSIVTPSIATAYTFTLPTNNGNADEVLLNTDGSSTMSFGKIADANVDAAAAISGSKIVAAGVGVTGVINATTQTIDGSKTFDDVTTFTGSITVSNPSTINVVGGRLGRDNSAAIDLSRSAAGTACTTTCNGAGNCMCVAAGDQGGDGISTCASTTGTRTCMCLCDDL